jgi:hypothetical protein
MPHDVIQIPGKIVLRANGDARNNCKACRFFESHGADARNVAAPETGQCIRFPPTAFVIGMQQTPNGPIPMVARARPPVSATETCGEFSRE